MNLDADTLGRLREIAGKATPGKWYVATETAGGHYVRSHEERDDGSSNYAVCEAWGGHGPNHSDAAHICAFNPQTAIALLDRIERLEGALKWYAAFADNPERAREALAGSDQSS